VRVTGTGTVHRNKARSGYSVAALCAALILSAAQNASGGEEQDYAVALAMYERQLFKVSYQYFQDFITKYPEGRYADSAQFYLGESLCALESYPEAIHEYRQLTANYPESAYVGKALMRTGDCFRKMENYEQAKKYYLKTISRSPNRSDAAKAYLRLGETYFAEGDYSGTTEIYEKTLDEFPEHPNKGLIEYRLGLAYHLNGDSETGLRYLKEVQDNTSTGAAATYGTAVILIEGGDYTGAVEEISKLQSESGERAPYDRTVNYHNVLALTGTGDYADAAELARETVAGLPAGAQSARLYYVLGYDLFSMRRWDEARTALDEAIRTDPEGNLSADASFLISLSYLEERRFEEAWKGFSPIGASDSPLSAKAKYWMGWIKYEEADYEEASRIFAEIVSDPNAGETGPAAIYWRGYCEKRRGNAAAGDIFVSLAKEYPDNELADDALLKAAEIALENGRNDDGRTWLTALVVNYPDSEFVEKANYLAAHSYAAQKDPGPAVAKLTEFLKKHPGSEYAPNATYDIGMVLFGDGDYAAASNWFGKVLTDYPGSFLAPDAMYQQGQCRFNKAEYDRAREIYESLVERYPKSPRVDEARYQIELCNYKKGEYSSQTEVAEAYVKKYPKSRLNQELYLLLGQSYYRKMSYNRSIEYLGRVSDADPAAFVTARSLMYEIYLRSGKIEDAAAVLRTVADSRAPKKDRADALLKLAGLYESAGDASKAISAYGEFAETFPKDERVPETLLAAGTAMRELKMYAESNVVLLNLLNKYPNVSETGVAELYVAFNYQRLGDYDNAIKYHKRVVEGGNRSLSVQSYYWLGVCTRDLGDTGAAAGYFNKIITNYRDFPEWVRKAEAEISKL
jgi:tol-pal system protein YbgF